MKNAKIFEIGKTYKGAGEVYGIKFKLLKRKNDICLFERSDSYYEVVTLNRQQQRTVIIKGQEIEFREREVFPTGDNWKGKCVSSLDRALEIYNEKTKGD